MKRKLVAALLSVAMVASITPVSALGPVASVEAAEAVTVESVRILINAIGAVGNYDADQLKKVEDARTAYDQLSDYDKKSVDASALTAAESTYEEYTKLITAAEAAIDAIGDTVVAADYEAEGSVTKAGTALGALLNKVDSKYVNADKYAKYTALVNNNQLKDVIDQIDALDSITDANYNTDTKVAAARTAYESLTSMQREMVGNYQKLAVAEKKISQYKDEVNLNGLLDVAAFTKTIGTGKDQVSVEDAQAAYDAAKAAYDKLSDTLKGKATEAKSKLDARAAAIAAYNKTVTDNTDAEAVIALIKALPDASAVTLDDEDSIKKAKEAYDALSVEGQGLIANSYKSKLNEVVDALDAKIDSLSDEARAKRVLDLITGLPATTAEVTRANTDAVKAVIEEYNVTGAATLAWRSGINDIEQGTPNSWQQIVKDDTSAYTKLLAAIQVIVSAENADEQAVKDLVAMDAYANAISVANNEQLKTAKEAVEKAEKAYSDANEYVKAEFAKDDYKTYRDNLTATKTNIEDYEGENDETNKSDAEAIITAIKALPAADNITADNLSNVKSQVSAVTSKLEAANSYVKAMVEVDASYSYYNEALAKIKTLEDIAAAPAVEAMINNLTVIDADAEESVIDAAVAANKTARDSLEALSDDQQGLVKNVTKLVKAEDAASTAIQNLISTEIAKIGNVTADLTDAQIAQINRVTSLLTKYNLESDDLVSTDKAVYENALSKITNEAQRAAGPIQSAIANLPDAVDKTVAEYIVNLYEQYTALSDAAKALITDAEVEKLQKAYDDASALFLDKAEITVSESESYTGDEVKPVVTIKDAKGNVILASEYEVYYSDNIDVGTATVVIVPTENSKYIGTLKGTFEITVADIKDAEIKAKTVTYTGKAQTPDADVIVGDRVLEEGTDYEITYSNNTNVGTATITITGKGNYTGTATGSFIVKPGKVNLTKVTAGTKKATAKYTGKTGASYKVIYAVKGTTKYKAVYSKNLTKTISGLKSGTTYKVKVLAYYKDASGKAYYTGYSNMRTVKVK